MKTKTFTILFFTILIIIGCFNNSKNDSIRKFQLQVANKKVIIEYDKLSLEIDTIINKKNTKIIKSVELNEKDKNIIFDLVAKTHKYKSYKISTPSCYAGYSFYFESIEKNDTLKIESISTSEWTTIFPEFNELNRILKANDILLKE